MTNVEERLTCFVIMPFNRKEDAAREDTVDFDKVYVDLIKEAIGEVNQRGIALTCVRSDEIQRAGLIQERMIAHIADADVAVVDITTANPNVYYELGVRHALRDRVTVLLRRRATRNPFNIAGMTTIEYDTDPERRAKACSAIANFVINGLRSGQKDSLVYAVLPGLKAGRDPKPITDDDVEEFEVSGAPGKIIGIVSGNLRHVNLGAKLQGREIEIWVNSENINMQMARPYDASISGLIRYLGALKDDTGTIVEDTIANELRVKMKRRQLVNPGEVVSTEAGTLAQTHKVRRVYHVAAVYGVVGTGFHPIACLDRCVTNALARADAEALGLVRGTGKRATGKPATSILFPVLATGTARADVIQNARNQVTAAIGYLRSRAEFTVIERVYFLAAHDVTRAGLRVVLAECGAKRVDASQSARAKPSPARRRRAVTRRKA